MSGRALARSLDELRKHRRSPVVRGPLSVVGGEFEPGGEPLAPNEATDCCMPAVVSTAQHSIDEGQAAIGGETATLDESVAPNEATDGRWLDEGREARRLARQESLRQLNRQSGPRPEIATANRTPRPGAAKKSNGTARVQANGRVACTRRQEKKTEARQMKELNGYVKIIRELGGLAGPTRRSRCGTSESMRWFWCQTNAPCVDHSQVVRRRGNPSGRVKSTDCQAVLDAPTDSGGCSGQSHGTLRGRQRCGLCQDLLAHPRVEVHCVLTPVVEHSHGTKRRWSKHFFVHVLEFRQPDATRSRVARPPSPSAKPLTR